MAAPSEFIEPTLLPDAVLGAVADAAAHPERALKVADLYKAAIGPRQQAYYLKQFARQEAGHGMRLSWHWPAFFSALNWCIFRKMWGWAGRYAALLAVLAVATVLGADAWGLERRETVALGAAMWVGVSVLAGAWANALYHRHCMALIHRVLVNGADREVAADVLAEQASGNQRFSGQVLVNVALLLFLPALATFAPWSGHHAWAWLTEAPVEQVAPEPLTPAAPAIGVADGERRVWPPGTATPTLKITSAETQASAPVSEALASAQAGWVLPGEPVPVARPAPPTSAGAFGVQVGIFAQPANVAHVLIRLKAQGLPVYTDAITLAGQPRTRVRVGPYTGHAEAQRVAGRIADVGLPAVVVPLPAPGANTRRR